ncbi:MAG: polysaccharide pyruvyl transferase CsaB [Vampirovibrionales bacterium]
MSKASQPMRHVALCGYVGFDNLGDELILQTLAKALVLHPAMPKPLHLTVFSQQPDVTQQHLQAFLNTLNASEHLTIQCIHRQSVMAILSTLWVADGFITGGGGLFQDKTGWKSPLYYGGLMRLAKVLGCKTLAYGQGMGPLMTVLGKFFTTFGLNTSDAVVVRDAQSRQLAQTLTHQPVIETTDTVWTGFEGTNNPAPVVEKQYALGLSLRPWPSFTPERLQHLAYSVGQGLQQVDPRQAIRVALLPCEPHTDEAMLREFQHLITHSHPNIQITLVKPADVESTIPQCQTVMGMRYHAVVLAAKANIPVWGLVYDPKVASVCHALALPSTAIEAIDTLTPETVAQWLQAPSHSNEAMLAHYQTLAQKNLDLLAAWLNHQPFIEL